MDQRNVNGQRASGSRGSSSFLEFSSTSIHYWTTKSLNSLNRLTKGKKSKASSKNQTLPDPAIGQSSVGSSATTVFGVDSTAAPQTTTFDERDEYYSYIREERYPRRQSDSTSVHYATLGRAGRHKVSAPSAHPYATHASGTDMYHRPPRFGSAYIDV
uniref:Uncharacterized protein n=1 Tax=Panagrellus redivivus TaxID=6233 RepID=A0A7E4VAJ6_PANRE